ncbi:MAG: hypothetical protein MUD15_10825 [Desulfobacterota bacterium]|jgi:hypothetical protein|nr:hypothetical protein [Thermodesulfobacteriota bacterium]
MRNAIMIVLMMPVLSLAIDMQAPYAFDLPDEAFRLMAEATVDPCSLCVEKKLKEAYAVMNRMLQPGLVMESDERCRFLKRNPGDGFELSPVCQPTGALKQAGGEGRKPPDVVFVFYTPQARLVGISENDYTDAGTAAVFNDSPLGTVFEGRIRLIPYKYGDGPTYTYFQGANKLQIHCTVIKLTPLKR